MVEQGDTRVLCAASIEDRVPPFLKDTGSGWVTAEYGMLPRATDKRTARDWRAGPPARSQEIQRLIGRSLRAVVDLDALGERSIIVDCDVLQADGGTRTAAITGGFVALVDAVEYLRAQKAFGPRPPILDQVAAVSVGIVGGILMLDLDFEEDSRASVDMNVVMNTKREIAEVQATAEGVPFSRARMLELMDLAEKGMEKLFAAQQQALAAPSK